MKQRDVPRLEDTRTAGCGIYFHTRQKMRRRLKANATKGCPATKGHMPDRPRAYFTLLHAAVERGLIVIRHCYTNGMSHE